MSLLCHGVYSLLYCRWRNNRVGILSDAQFQTAKVIALLTIPLFFPGNAMKPWFVPLQPNVASRMGELKDELKQHQPAVAAARAPGEAISVTALHHEAVPAHLEIRKEVAVAPVSHAPPPPAAAAASVPAHPLRFEADIDQGIDDQEEEKEIKEHDLQWEMHQWFSPAAPQLKWNDAKSQPAFTWKRDEDKYPRLSLLARRFLCILPTSAPSERVWSGFGHIINKQSTHIDSTIASQTMYLRYNHDLTKEVPVRAESQRRAETILT